MKAYECCAIMASRRRLWRRVVTLRSATRRRVKRGGTRLSIPIDCFTRDFHGRVLQLHNAAISTIRATQSNSRRSAGSVTPHIINPKTGKGLTTRVGVTVIAAKGIDSDGLFRSSGQRHRGATRCSGGTGVRRCSGRARNRRCGNWRRMEEIRIEARRIAGRFQAICVRMIHRAATVRRVDTAAAIAHTARDFGRRSRTGTQIRPALAQRQYRATGGEGKRLPEAAGRASRRPP